MRSQPMYKGLPVLISPTVDIHCSEVYDFMWKDQGRVEMSMHINCSRISYGYLFSHLLASYHTKANCSLMISFSACNAEI